MHYPGNDTRNPQLLRRRPPAEATRQAIHEAIRAMPHNVISTCPVCSGELSVTRLQCRTCGTAIEGEFNVGRFGRLGHEQLALLESFLRARGNLKELERELKVSYPTVRARVDALVKSLGLSDAGGADGADGADGAVGDGFDDEFVSDDDFTFGSGATRRGPAAASANGASIADTRRDVLERLARHEIGAEEAAALIRALGREE